MARSLSLVFAICCAFSRSVLAQEKEIALEIVYDTSGSMRDAVRDVAGKGAPKYTIGNRALLAVIQRLHIFAENNPGRLRAGLVVFDGRSARQAVKLRPFDATEMRTWARSFISPDGPTPLGPAVQLAGEALLEMKATQRHVLVITDGENTAGPDPAEVIRALQKKEARLAFHFIAFDVNARAFAPIKDLGATVVSAADEQELNSQLEFILEEKILLEK